MSQVLNPRKRGIASIQTHFKLFLFISNFLKRKCSSILIVFENRVRIANKHTTCENYSTVGRESLLSYWENATALRKL